MPAPCPLCDSTDTLDYFRDKKRDYLQCLKCELVFVPACYHLSNEDEKAEYDKHENSLTDEGYLRFLSRASAPLVEYFAKTDSSQLSGLDFGCGPAPALANMLNGHGFDTKVYDPYFFPTAQQLSRQYDFVTCTEVVEHFNTPKTSLEQLLTLLKPNAVLVIMTKLVINQQRFATWHYKNDPTHISFFSENTFRFIANKYQLKFKLVDNDVIF